MDIFSDHIEFDIHGGAGFDGPDVSMFEGVGDDGDVEPGSFDIEDGEADAVEADGAFFNDEVAEFFWKFETKFPAAVEFFPIDAGGGGVDMALDDVSVQPAVDDEASFQVDQVAGLPVAETGFFERFPDSRHAVAGTPGLIYGEADTVM